MWAGGSVSYWNHILVLREVANELHAISRAWRPKSWGWAGEAFERASILERAAEILEEEMREPTRRPSEPTA